MNQPTAGILKLAPDEVMKFWLLNLATECPVWLGRLFPVVEEVALNVKSIPRRVPTDYARGIVDLFDSGMIKLSSEVPEDEVENTTGVARVVERFLTLSKDDASPVSVLPMYERARLPGMKVSFRLTSLGGASWEQVAEPDWNRFVSVGTHSATEGLSESGELIAVDRDLILAYMGWYPEVNGEQIRLDTINWRTHADFEVLYWKRLRFVYHASFEVSPAKSRWHGFHEPQWFRDWWASTRSWHKNPWELPNWPSE